MGSILVVILPPRLCDGSRILKACKDVLVEAFGQVPDSGVNR